MTTENSGENSKSSPVLLTINGGSSSIKFAVFAVEDLSARAVSGKLERIGLGASSMTVKRGGGESEESQVNAPDMAAAAQVLTRWLESDDLWPRVLAVGHRIVHGGQHHVEPEPVTLGLLDDLRDLSPFDPEHLPGEIALIESIANAHENIPQYVCFDTAFHRHLPRVAQLLPIPRKFEREGVRRYGFHGLSYEYLLEALKEQGSAKERVILAHLGAGASLAAVLRGECVDTTMAFTPTAGLMMGTRSGDLDPGLVGYLARAEGMTAEQFHAMVNSESGLLGVSELSADVRDLIAMQESDVRAREALDLFCYQIKKWIGAFTAVLGGLDMLVFSGGIGEHSAQVRATVCEGLADWLGIEIDHGLNRTNAPTITTASSRVIVMVIPTDEERTIARSVARLSGASQR